MAIHLKPEHLQRYRDIARLLIKHNRGDLLRGSEVGDELLLGSDVPEDAAPSHSVATNGPRTAPSPGEELAKDLEALGPTFVKVGQFLSTRADLLPVSYLEPLARLQDQVEPFPFAEVERIVSSELGVRLSKAFVWFEEKPVAAASLGQVHRAELRSGRVVAVKVQRPDIREQILHDLEALADIAELVDRHSEVGRRNDFVSMLDEFRKTLLKELDYRREARHLTILGENLAGFDWLIVPRPIADYVSARVLTMELIRGRKVTALGPLSRMELNGRPLAEDLCRAYLQQILVDGFFHADPHPGNVFVTEDGRLALLDLGMVAHLAPRMQEHLLKLVLAISEGRADDAASLVLRIGRPLPGADEPGVQRRVAEMVMQFQGLKLREIALGRMLFEAAHVAAEGNVRMPRELTLLGKTLLNVDEVARRLDPEFDPNASIRKNVAAITTQRMWKSLSPGKMFSGLLELKEFTEKLPGRLNRLIDAASENRIRLKVDAIDEVLLMEGLQKIANRITLGLVISALIIGAALLMRIETSFRILGYPGLAILFFMAAALSGLVLAVNILLHDIRTRKERLRSLQKHLASTSGPAGT